MTLIANLVLLSIFFPNVALAQDISGDWLAVLQVPGSELHFALHVTKDPNGSLNAILGDADRKRDWAAYAVTVHDSVLMFTVEPIHGFYEGKINADASSVSGAWWTQNSPTPLNFHHRRPHEPFAFFTNDNLINLILFLLKVLGYCFVLWAVGSAAISLKRTAKRLEAIAANISSNQNKSN